MIAVGLALLTVVLAGPVPRLMARQSGFRRAPRAALVVWQLVTTAGVLAALAVAPAAVAAVRTPDHGPDGWVAAAAALVSVVVAGRLLLTAHIVGRRLRSARRVHRELVDLIGRPDQGLGPTGRLLDHRTPTAYCVPGIRRRIVLSRGALERLSPEELAAVLSHERAHLRARHDLVVEFFTVVHQALPPPWRCAAAMDEVRLLVEVLADRAAAREVGAVPVGRALARLVQPADAQTDLGPVAPGPGAAVVRIGLLNRPAPPWAAPLMYGFGALAVAAPVALLVVAWS